MWHRCCIIVQPQRLRSKMSKVDMWMPPGIHMSSACFYWFSSHFCMFVFRKSSWKQLPGWSWGSCGVCWCCPNPGLGAERRTLIHLPGVFNPPELLPQCFYDLISLYHTFCWCLCLCHSPLSLCYQCVGRLSGRLCPSQLISYLY